MSDLKQGSTLNRKNKKGLALKSPPVKAAAPSAGDAQIPGALGNNDARTDTLEIGVEFKLDLRNEDLQVLKELGSGNGGTVSKVMHTATKVVMAKKARSKDDLLPIPQLTNASLGHSRRGEERDSQADCSRTAYHA